MHIMAVSLVVLASLPASCTLLLKLGVIDAGARTAPPKRIQGSRSSLRRSVKSMKGARESSISAMVCLSCLPARLPAFWFMCLPPCPAPPHHSLHGCAATPPAQASEAVHHWGVINHPQVREM